MRRARPGPSAPPRGERQQRARRQRRARVSPSAPPRPTLPYVEFASNPRAGILFDVDTGEVLWERHPDRQLPIASLTKMLTALIIVERHRPGEMVEITPQAVAFEGSGVGVLPEGEEVPRGAAAGAAAGLRQRRRNRARPARCGHAGLRRSHEPLAAAPRPALLALHQPARAQDEGNYSCPRDLATLARADLAERRVARIVGADHDRFKFPVEGGYLDLYNNNPFIRAGTPGITGLKTGYTDAAGRCYVTTARQVTGTSGSCCFTAPTRSTRCRRCCAQDSMPSASAGPVARARAHRVGAMLRPLFALLAALAALLVLPGVASAQERDDDDTIVVITGGASVADGETVDGVYVLDGPVTIAGTVDGDVVVVNGDTEISGEVTGDVTVLAKRAVIASGARIGGDLRYGDEEPGDRLRSADRRRG